MMHYSQGRYSDQEKSYLKKVLSYLKYLMTRFELLVLRINLFVLKKLHFQHLQLCLRLLGL